MMIFDILFILILHYIFLHGEQCPLLLSSRLLSKNLKIKMYKTIILPVVLYGCEVWSLTLKEEYLGTQGMRMEQALQCELHSLYRSPNIARVNYI